MKDYLDKLNEKLKDITDAMKHAQQLMNQQNTGVGVLGSPRSDLSEADMQIEESVPFAVKNQNESVADFFLKQL